jgi:ADP-ribose pyrophosphatase YjhB (NUDIX family)
MSADPLVHKRFLEHLERYTYFAKGVRTRVLSYDEFAVVDAEQRLLRAKGDRRDDDEEARWAELTELLFRD